MYTLGLKKWPPEINFLRAPPQKKSCFHPKNSTCTKDNIGQNYLQCLNSFFTFIKERHVAPLLTANQMYISNLHLISARVQINSFYHHFLHISIHQ